MKIYFSEATADIEMFGTDGTFEVQDGFGNERYFYNGVEHGTNPGGMDEVRIFDGCGRSIPVAVENIPELVEALNYCFNNIKLLEQAQKLEQALQSDAERFVEDYDGYCEVNDAE